MKAKTKKAKTNDNGKSLTNQTSLNQAVKSICDILRRSNCKGAMQYVPELTWILFLRILDEREQKEAEKAQMFGRSFTPSLREPYRWHDWAATPDDSLITQRDGKPQGWKRRQITEGKQNAFIAWVNSELLPYLHKLEKQPNASPRQKVISEVMSGVKQVRVDTDKNFLDVLDKVQKISEQNIDTTHLFPLSQAFEGLLLKMGEKGGDGGQFFTPREIIRAMVRVVDPKIGETVYDAACGTGGFLAQSYEYMLGEDFSKIQSPADFDTLKLSTFYGREQDDITYTIALANLVLHQIDRPHIWHGNALTGDATYDGLYTNAPDKFDVVLMNPPFGGKESAAAQINFEYKTGATQVLFLQLAMKQLKDGGRCGIVMDEGVLFRTNEQAFVKTKRKLLDECDLYCIVSLPGGVFTQAGAGVKTNLLFFNKGQRTEKIWYYDLSDIKVGKKTPLTIDKFDEFFRLLPERADSERSWTIDFSARREKARKESEPFKQKVRQLENEAYETREKVKQLKLQSPQNKDAINGLLKTITELEVQVRENRAKAEAIENAIYDIKAVNPNAKDTTDKRTPSELISFIHEKSKEVQSALARLAEIS
jgi:type I restriction enzyme M protein